MSDTKPWTRVTMEWRLPARAAKGAGGSFESGARLKSAITIVGQA